VKSCRELHREKPSCLNYRLEGNALESIAVTLESMHEAGNF